MCISASSNVIRRHSRLSTRPQSDNTDSRAKSKKIQGIFHQTGICCKRPSIAARDGCLRHVCSPPSSRSERSAGRRLETAGKEPKAHLEQLYQDSEHALSVKYSSVESPGDVNTKGAATKVRIAERHREITVSCVFRKALHEVSAADKVGSAEFLEA